MKCTLNLTYEIFDNFDQLNLNDQNLLNHAIDACLHAYAPYSNFKVGAAILTESQRIITGSNHENASYPCGICAERTALHHYHIIASNEKILALGVTTEKLLIDTAFPCGFCRQVMVETELNNNAPIRLIVGQKSGKSYVFDSCSHLLPFSFHPDLLLATSQK
jgi:cytidine deaminase